MLDYLMNLLPAQMPVNPYHMIYGGAALVALAYLSLAVKGGR